MVGGGEAPEITYSRSLPGVDVLWGTADGGRLSLFKSNGKKSPGSGLHGQVHPGVWPEQIHREEPEAETSRVMVDPGLLGSHRGTPTDHNCQVPVQDGSRTGGTKGPGRALLVAV